VKDLYDHIAIKLIEHWIFGGNNGTIESNRMSLWAVKR